MYQLSYCSKATHEINEDVISAILKTAIAHNEIFEITGCLVYHNYFFVQIIEGNKKDIKSLYEKIKKDKRHFDVTLLWEGKNSERNFSDWNMAFYSGCYENDKNDEIKNFERNLLLLSELSEVTTTTLNMFWVSVRKLITENFH